jgi:hypothetical protein
MMRRLSSVLALAIVSVAAPARGDEADDKARAAELFRQADEASDRGEPDVAAGLYARAYRIAPHAITKYNEALEWEKASERPRAADAYEDALDRGELDASRVRDARLRLAALKKQLGYLVVTSPIGATVEVAHVRGAPVPTNLHLPPGDHEVVVTHADCQRGFKVTMTAGETHELEAECEPAAKPPPRPPPKRRPPPDKRGPNWMRGFGWATVAIGIAGGLSLLPLAQTTIDANDRWKDSGLTDEGAHEKAIDFRTATNVVLAASAVVFGVGLTLVILAPDEDASESATLVLTPSNASLEARF